MALSRQPPRLLPRASLSKRSERRNCCSPGPHRSPARPWSATHWTASRARWAFPAPSPVPPAWPSHPLSRPQRTRAPLWRTTWVETGPWQRELQLLTMIVSGSYMVSGCEISVHAWCSQAWLFNMRRCYSVHCMHGRNKDIICAIYVSCIGILRAIYHSSWLT